MLCQEDSCMCLKNLLLVCLCQAVTYCPIVHWISLRLVLLNRASCYLCSAVLSNYPFAFPSLLPGQPGLTETFPVWSEIALFAFPKSSYPSNCQFPNIHPFSADKKNSLPSQGRMKCCGSLLVLTTLGFHFEWELEELRGRNI